MIGLAHIKQVYFLGIGGIGMSALARYFKHLDYQVLGYDRTETILTKQLAKEGIDVHYEDKQPAWLKKKVKKESALIVFTPAIPADLGERVFFEQNAYTMKKRSEVLGLICNTGFCAAVAGTHGKTSVSTMLAHLMKDSAVGCNAFLGGISKNYQSNLLLNSKSRWFVAEADEFDRSFLRLFPNLAVITSTDPDHLDIYGTHNGIVNSFNKFAGQVKSGGSVIVKKGLPIELPNENVNCYTYSLDEEADFYTQNLELKNETYQFDWIHPEGKVEGLQLNYPGLMNVENAVAALALALLAGVSADELRKALPKYEGVRRRFDIRFRNDHYLLIDDYAHHPTELKATIDSVKAMFSGRKLTGIFQPHLFSRTRDFANGFAHELNKMDELILLDIYPAREKPMQGVSSRLIFGQVKNKNKKLIKKDKLLLTAEDLEPGVILMMGAGDIDTMVDPLIEKLKLNEHA